MALHALDIDIKPVCRRHHSELDTCHNIFLSLKRAVRDTLSRHERNPKKLAHDAHLDENATFLPNITTTPD
jgi:hypothetical protein